MVQQLASDERVQVTDGGVLAFEIEADLKVSGRRHFAVLFDVQLYEE